MHPDTQNRRLEDRVDTSGDLLLWLDDPVPQQVHAVLIDSSKSGFRALHEYAPLCAGQVVRFQRPIAKGRARVVWNRISGGKVETGFVLL